MSELIRYTETFSGMEPDDIGDWVTFDDAKALQDEVTKLNNKLFMAEAVAAGDGVIANTDITALQERLRGHEAALESTEMMNGQQSDQLLEQSKTIHSLTQRLAEVERCLEQLIFLKAHKEMAGKTDFYLEQQPIAWRQADKVLSNSEVESDDGI